MLFWGSINNVCISYIDNVRFQKLTESKSYNWQPRALRRGEKRKIVMI